MIPLQLQVKNFLSYGNQIQTVNFEPYSLICLSGKNGHGKSALLDAITWAIWGQARRMNGTSRVDEGVLRLGQTHMMVLLDFQAQGITYRVRRDYTLTGSKGINHLEFGVINDPQGTPRSLTEKTIRGTQATINQCLGLDYESFINSAFLRQGQSNEFSKKSARERKEVLASILGLDKYELLRKKAMEKTKLLSQERDVLFHAREQIQAEIEQQGDITTAITQVTEELERVLTQERQYITTKEAHEQARQNLLGEKQHLTTVLFKQEQLREQEKQHVNQLRDKITLWRATLRQQKNLTEYQTAAAIQTDEHELKKLHEKAQKYHQARELAQTTKDTLEQRKHELEREFTRQKQEWLNHKTYQETVLTNLEEGIKQLTAQYDREQKTILSLLQEQDVTLIRKTQITQLLQKYAQEEKLFERRKNYYHKFITHGNFLKKELQECVTKKELLQSHNSSCPFCQQSLTLVQKTDVLKTVQTHESRLKHQIGRLSKVLKTLKELLLEQHTLVTQAKKQHQEYTALETQLLERERQKTAITERLQEISALLTERQNEHAALTLSLNEHAQKACQETVEQRISTDHQCQELTRTLVQYQKQLEKNKAHEQAYHAALERSAERARSMNAYQALLTHIALQDERKKEIKDLISLIKISRKEQQILGTQTSQYTSLLRQEEIITHELATVQYALQKLLQEKEELLQKKGALDHHSQLLEQKKQDLKKYTTQCATFDNNLEEYQLISHALSKDGIQALLIEEAIPEIEYEANKLLTRLTDNQSHLLIDSVRDLKSGATKETLDIKISDNLGIRPYELFSGGEAFRIDFALRIAISKLLARRAGATLQTLIIDEGFGSQDEEGLLYIMDTIYKIQEDFAKIIIVSHLTSMKEQFPVNFFVSKSSQGSTIRTVENG